MLNWCQTENLLASVICLRKAKVTGNLWVYGVLKFKNIMFIFVGLFYFYNG